MPRSPKPTDNNTFECSKCNKPRLGKRMHDMSKLICGVCYTRDYIKRTNYVPTKRKKDPDKILTCTICQKQKPYRNFKNKIKCDACHQKIDRSAKRRYSKRNPNRSRYKRLFGERLEVLSRLYNTPDNFKLLKSLYKDKPDGYQVDHIIPLRHPDICGLHVPWNLQYLTVEENMDKSNKWDGTYSNTKWKKNK